MSAVSSVCVRWATAAIVFALTPCATAEPQPCQGPCGKGPYPLSHTRLLVGEELGTLRGGGLWVNGEARPREDATFYGGVHVGAAYSPGDGEMGVSGLVRISTWETHWSSLRDENRYRLDLSAGPALRFGGDRARPRSGWHFAAPAGVTLAWLEAGPGRSVQEIYAVGYGLNLGLSAGYDIAGVHHGAFFDVGWTTHLTWIGRDVWPVADPGASTHETLRMLDHVLALTVGYTYWL